MNEPPNRGEVPYIAWTEDADAEGDLAALYNEWKRNNPGRDSFPGIMKCFSARPDFLKQVMEFSYGLHFADGHLDRRTKEMIATWVSALNACRY
jgi:hypothetical protein